jgi:acid phosphatase (class A)
MGNRYNAALCRVVLVLAFVAISAGCGIFTMTTKPASVSETRPGVVTGYLAPQALPNSVALLPSPPAAGSAALALDTEANRESIGSRGTPRWRLAAEDADLRPSQVAGTFSCALNAPITEQETPRLYQLMRRVMIDAALSTFRAKSQYNRPRPFVVNKKTTCTPAEEGILMKSGSYPSGHAAIGWALALILCEIAPEQTDALLARGRAFGESRMVCNVHWQSDVSEGRMMGAATVARLHADPQFRADVEAAKAELAVVRAKGLQPTRDCKAEAEALACHVSR